MKGKDRSAQIISLIALVVAVIALTIGFAAFTTQLTISSQAEVTTSNDTLDVVFSTQANSVSNTNQTVAGTGTGGATADNATLNATTVTGIKANFTEPGQTVTYTFNVYNNSAYTAYLNGITFANVSGSSPASKKVCTPNATNNNAATQGVDDACNGISVSVQVGSTNATDTKTAAQIGTHTLAAVGSQGNSETVTVTVAYASGSSVADGDFSVEFGDITFDYSTVPES